MKKDSIESFKNILVEICIMPTINPQSYPFNPRGVKQLQGLILKEWAHNSDHTNHMHQYLDILVEGSIVRYWKPLFSKSFDYTQERMQALSDSNHWEIAGPERRMQSFTIKPIQKNN